ncbi:MAG: amidohydrolase family protein [Planctomycetota bacterium]
MIRPILAATCVAATLSVQGAVAQDAPLRGLRKVDPRWHALVGATVIPEPGARVENATIVVRDGVIVSVEANGEPPAGARVRDCAGLVIHAGFVEMHVGVDAPKPDGDALGNHWQTEMAVPQRSALDGPRLDEDTAEALREIGFTAAAIAPADGILRGSAAVVALGAEGNDVVAGTREVVENHVYQALSFRTAGWGSSGLLRYPTSEMGAIALARQAFLDADRHQICLAVDANDPAGHEPPQPSAALEAIAAGGPPLLFDARNELQILRAARLAAEFSRPLVALGTGTEYRRIAAIAEAGIPVVVPVAYPDAPDVSTGTAQAAHDLRTLAGWEQAPTNARRLVDAGVTIALSSERLEDRDDFGANVRAAIEHGLGEDEALRALTTTPARLLGVDDRIGRIAPGMLAHLVVRTDEPFVEDSEIREVWVAGRPFEVEPEPEDERSGEYAWSLARFGDETDLEGTLRIEDGSKLTFVVGDSEAKAQKVKVGPQHVHFHIDGADLGADGIYTGTGLFEGETLHGSLVGPDGKLARWTASRVGDLVASDDADEEEVEATESDEEDVVEEVASEIAEELALPFGAYGRLALPAQRSVVVKNATIWTSAEAGTVEGAVLVVDGGKVRYVGPEEFAPKIEGAEVIDAEGKHVAPGLIDCHSHTGISGGVNEVGRRVTAEVRIADVIDPDDISFYRQLAGGLTAANQLHGSANAIGGQSAVVKLRWGVAHPDAMRVNSAMPGIKFALGENPKRVAAGTDIPDEYPQTRMGVAALIEDRLQAGLEYRAAHDRYEALSNWEKRSTMPPKRDLELEALGEIVAGERLIHCHSYRQDEILMLARVARQYGFKIGTFQHILEGYKVAEEVGESALGASTFSDWWAYKFEVVDAIPHNAAIMSEVGVNVSINSDSDEHARRLNTEAAKAVKYGGMAPAEALKLVTINPAIQLGVDDRMGSLEAGKDADFAIWSGDPLSYTSRCESTWIDGREMFSIAEDAELRDAAEAERQRIVQKLLRSDVGAKRERPRLTGMGATPPSRDLDAMREELESLWRSGADPSLARPGVCGCFDVLFEMARASAQR